MMNLQDIRDFISRMNAKGVPLPLIRDSKTGIGSVSLTLVFLSSIYVQLALLNSFALLFKGVDVINALYWHGLCLSLYFGRSFKKDGNKVELSGDDTKEK
jgi:hypothetical protein